jgi:hypothetical protein
MNQPGSKQECKIVIIMFVLYAIYCSQKKPSGTGIVQPEFLDWSWAESWT